MYLGAFASGCKAWIWIVVLANSPEGGALHMPDTSTSDPRVKAILDRIQFASTKGGKENTDKRDALRRLVLAQLTLLADSSDPSGPNAVDEAYNVALQYSTEEALDAFMRGVRNALGEGKRGQAEKALDILSVLNDQFLGLNPDHSMQGKEGP